ncbi:MAG: alpha-amylase family glycosyl hydrolase, partial [Ilumatobacteraceae bacterium]
MVSEIELAARVDDRRDDLVRALTALYDDPAGGADRLLALATDAVARRPARLVDRDRARLADPDWFLSNRRIGYTAYLERFADDLPGLLRRLDHLTELGIDTIHLLSVLHPRHGENDGGFAVRDHTTPDPRLGTVEHLTAAIDALHGRGISLCLDFVLNHTSDDHEWAMAAKNGSVYHRQLFRTYTDRGEPDRWEEHLPEIFPDLAPGNFTWVPELDRWVWTTFREFQWDLDYSNPDVLVEVAGIALELANLGVDILRLDAVAFTWKQLGTSCQNRPEAHLIAQAIRAVLAIAAPATILLAEAIVGPGDLVGYLGRHDVERRECDLAYHNQLMVQAWSMAATRRAELAGHALAQLPDPPSRTSWFTYIRCHDDIGWAIDDADAAACGLSGPAHRAFLAEFYRGDFPGSFARGTPFGVNAGTGDERTSGMTATLAGVTAALAAGDEEALDQAIRRILLLSAIVFGYGGIPMIHMGDELCQQDDPTWRDDPARRNDSRWAHRPRFDDALAARRHDLDSPTGRMWSGIRHLVAVRRACHQLDEAGAASRPFDTGIPGLFGWHRRHPRHGEFVGLANVGPTVESCLRHPDLGPGVVDRLAPADRGVWDLAPLQVRWITTDPANAGGAARRSRA